jgi:acyl-CoA reductase-like NAD-dependent aldehyde dehydrogenase
LVKQQREFFNSGATLPIDFRKQQLNKLKEVVVANKDAYVDAIYKDLRRPKVLAVHEVDHIISMLDNLNFNPKKL